MNPPANAPSRRNSTRSLSDSRSWLQSTDARSVCCRGSAPRAPPVSRWKRSARPAAICSIESIRTRAAASSIASGIPSRSEQIWATAGALSLVTAKFDRAFIARSMNSLTASYCDSDSTGSRAGSSGSASAGTRQALSPGTPSGARLVARAVTPGQLSRIAVAASAHFEQVLAVVKH